MHQSCNAARAYFGHGCGHRTATGLGCLGGAGCAAIETAADRIERAHSRWLVSAGCIDNPKFNENTARSCMPGLLAAVLWLQAGRVLPANSHVRMEFCTLGWYARAGSLCRPGKTRKPNAGYEPVASLDPCGWSLMDELQVKLRKIRD